MNDKDFFDLSQSHYSSKADLPKLTSCPFCGGEVDITITRNKVNSVMYYAWCSGCQIESPKHRHDTVEQVVKYWNRPAFKQLDELKIDHAIIKAEKNGIIDGLKDAMREALNDNLESENNLYMRLSKITTEKEKADKALMDIADSCCAFVPQGDGDEDNCSYCEAMIQTAQTALKGIKY